MKILSARPAAGVSAQRNGGGNARKLKKLPKNVRLGSNAYAFRGGFRAWRKIKKS
jgi:hypothetical protein